MERFENFEIIIISILIWRFGSCFVFFGKKFYFYFYFCFRKETTLGEGWYGVSRPAEKKAAPPPPARDGRKKLYTTVAVKEGFFFSLQFILFIFFFFSFLSFLVCF